MSEFSNFVTDPEFDAFPEDFRVDATKSKVATLRRLESARQYRKVRNIVGVTALAVATSLGIAKVVHEISILEDPGIAISVVDGLALAAAGIADRENQYQKRRALFSANAVGQMFTVHDLTPPAWTQDPSPLTAPSQPSQFNN
jgi:hypothetical protein